jgi:two-component system chemotaxis response regulator CheB
MITYKKKVVLVEDSPVALEILQRLLNSSPEVNIVGVARDGIEALEIIAKTQPDVICTDLLMEKMDGIELTKQVMAQDPRPILVISNFVQKTDIDNIFRVLQAGAADVFPKPTTGSPVDYEQVKAALITKIKVLSNMKVATQPQPIKLTNSVESIPSWSFLEPEILPKNSTSRLQVIAIGASTGSLQALQKILSQLPTNFPVPVIVTQHMREGMLSGLVNWLSSQCALKVKIAQINEFASPGTIYFAPEKTHLELDSRGIFIYSRSLIGEKHCPSITVTFKSVARLYGRGCAGVLLTGLGSDGAEGLQTISTLGGITIAQNEPDALFGMVKEAVVLGAVQNLVDIEEIAPFLLEIVFKD